MLTDNKMLTHNKSIAESYLKENGYFGDKLLEILSGFDFHYPIYQQPLYTEEIIYQFTRLPSHSNLSPPLGNWFCRPGATLNDLAIISGNSGRDVAKVEVIHPLITLEGTAGPQSINWIWSGGGQGGGTQTFIPLQYLRYLKILGFFPNIRGALEP